jgi:hypothetical protein
MATKKMTKTEDTKPQKKKARVEFKTPRGRTGFCYIDREDPEYGSYKVRMFMEPDAPGVADLVELFEELLEKLDVSSAKKKKAYLPFEETDDGLLKFTFKSDFKPKVRDVKGNLIVNPKVGSGSVIRVAGVAWEYENGANCGVTAKVNSIRLIELNAFGGGVDAFAGDDEDADGYVYEGADDAEEADSAEDGDEDDF